jgi:uncharacterized protein YdaU (DUF1376 family)
MRQKEPGGRATNRPHMATRGYDTYPHRVRSSEEIINVPISKTTKANISKILPKLSVQEWSYVSSVLDAFYEFGRKDGARSVFERIAGDIDAAKAAIPHKRPGRPKNPPRAAKKKVGKSRKRRRKKSSRKKP